MNESITLTVTGKNSILGVQYHPPIELNPQKHYVIGLVELYTFNSIPNIDNSNNKFYIEKEEPITIPEGSYELEDINRYLNKELTKKGISLSLESNNNTLKSIIRCSKNIDFTPVNSIGKLLGFTSRILEANKSHQSDLSVKIFKINSIRVQCNIATGSYINQRADHTIHEFFPTVAPGYKIIEAPLSVIYLPINVKSISYLEIRIEDQDGHLINFRGEEITLRLHIRSY